VLTTTIHAKCGRAAVFDPWLLPPVVQGDHYQYSWTGAPEPQIVKLAGAG
jgi:hypothetical protein